MARDHCAQCGLGTPGVGILYHRIPAYVDDAGYLVATRWQRIGAMCNYHLGINGEWAKKLGHEIKVEPISPPGIERKP